jgi:hypothetical protein
VYIGTKIAGILHSTISKYYSEEFEDTNGVIRTENTLAKRKSTKEQTTIYKAYT